MFQWTTTTIINSLNDYKHLDENGNALPLIKIFDDATKYPGASATNPILKIKRDHTFESRYVTKVFKALANDAALCKMEVDLSSVLTKMEAVLTAQNVSELTGRLNFYIALEGSEEHIYANDWYQKGKPFSIGFNFTTGATSSDILKQVVANDKKHGVAMYGKKIFNLAENNGKLTITGTHEYQRIKMASVVLDLGIDETPIVYFEDGDPTSNTTVFKVVERGVNGFGTYGQIVKDLRLPTAHHNKWLQIKEDETPIVGAKYNQYILTYCAPSLATPGFSIIGQTGMSTTTHVFWVNQDVDAAFQKAIEDSKIGIELVGYTTDGGTTSATAGADGKVGTSDDVVVTKKNSKA